MKEIIDNEQDGFKADKILQADIGNVENTVNEEKDNDRNMFDVSNDIKAGGDIDDHNVSEQKCVIKFKKTECQKLCLIELTYKCKDCLKSFDLMEDLQKHIDDDNKCVDLSDVACENRLESPSVNDELSVKETNMTTDLSDIVEDGVKVSIQDSVKNDNFTVKVETAETSTEVKDKCLKFNDEDKPNSVTDPVLTEPSNDKKEICTDFDPNDDRLTDIDVKLEEKGGDGKDCKSYDTVGTGLDDDIDDSDDKQESSGFVGKNDGDQNIQLETNKVETKSSLRLRTRKSSEYKSRNLQHSEELGMMKKRTSTQAKNNLTNPSKGKRKRIRDTENLNKEDEAFMKAFGIFQSKVCLNRVTDIEIEDKKTESVCETKTSKAVKKYAEDITYGKNDNLILDKKDNPVKTIFHNESNDLDKLNVEDEGNKATSYVTNCPSDEKMTFTRSRKKQLINSKTVTKSSIKNDEELLKQFGLKEMTIKVTKSPVKTSVWVKPGPRCKTMPDKLKMDPLPDVHKISVPKSTIEVDTMSEDEIQEMLRKCGMGISVPVPLPNAENINNKRENITSAKRKASPEPSTSRGHGHLKRSKTARKSVNDSVLFDKYKLKDSKVILKSLSRIDISLLRNPNSPFGKSDWLKHKFDSDSDSDMEWDIPTPPITEDFIENPISHSAAPNKLDTKSIEKSPQKCSDSEILEKFGINDSVVVLESPKKKDRSPLKYSVPLSFSSFNEASPSKCSIDSVHRKTLSDAELMRKFGIPEVKVILSADKTPNQSLNVSKQAKKSEGESFEKLDFTKFKSVVDDTCKSILSKLKNLKETNANDTNENIDDHDDKSAENVKVAVKRRTRLSTARNDDKKEPEKSENRKTPKEPVVDGDNILNKRKSSVQSKPTVKKFRKHLRSTKKQNMKKVCTMSTSFSSILTAKERASSRSKRLKQLTSAKKVSSSLVLAKATRTKNFNNSWNTKGRGNEKVSVRESPRKSNSRNNKCSSSLLGTECKNIPDLVKSLPVVHVKVPVLSDADILKLTKQNKTVVNEESEPDKDIIDDSELIVKDVLNDLIDEVTSSTDKPVNADENLTVQDSGKNDSDNEVSQPNDLKEFEIEETTDVVNMKHDSFSALDEKCVNNKLCNETSGKTDEVLNNSIPNIDETFAIEKTLDITSSELESSKSNIDERFAIEQTSLGVTSSEPNAIKTSQNCEANDSNSCIETDISLISDFSFEDDDKMAEGKDEVDGEKYDGEDKLKHSDVVVNEVDEKNNEAIDAQCSEINDLLDVVPIGVSKFFDENYSEKKDEDDVDMRTVDNDYDDDKGYSDDKCSNDGDNVKYVNDDNNDGDKVNDDDDDNHNDDVKDDDCLSVNDDKGEIKKYIDDCGTDVMNEFNEIESVSNDVDISKFEPLQEETVPRESSVANSGDITDNNADPDIEKWLNVKED